MNRILSRQLAIDYCCTEEDVIDSKNHFNEHRFLEGRRRFLERDECALKITDVNGKLLFCGQKHIIDRCREEYADTGSAWFFEAKNLIKIDEMLREYGYRIDKVHPFFISEEPSEGIPAAGCEIRLYGEDDIEQFRGDKRFPEAFTFCETAPDVIGVGALRDGKIIGMAGASADSPTMWQIGINVEPEATRSGIAKLLVDRIRNEILAKGILPYYGTAMSHIASQRTALGVGFDLTWVELITESSDDSKQNS